MFKHLNTVSTYSIFIYDSSSRVFPNGCHGTALMNLQVESSVKYRSQNLLPGAFCQSEQRNNGKRQSRHLFVSGFKLGICLLRLLRCSRPPPSIITPHPMHTVLGSHSSCQFCLSFPLKPQVTCSRLSQGRWQPVWCSMIQTMAAVNRWLN